MKKPTFSLSSLSHKYVMALAGLFLMLFLVTHLSTNLLMLKSREAFDQAVAFLSGNPAIKIMEYVLFAGFLIHMALGIVIQWHNQRSRPVKYKISPRSDTSAFSRFMFHTGVIILIFLVIHLINFFFIKLGWVPLPEDAANRLDFYPVAERLFQNPWYSALYIISFIFLGFHLKHGFQSAFQSLGLNHNRYFPAIQFFGTLYSILIPLGFAVIPVYFLFFV